LGAIPALRCNLFYQSLFFFVPKGASQVALLDLEKIDFDFKRIFTSFWARPSRTILILKIKIHDSAVFFVKFYLHQILIKDK
jgi:hypothetical protein